jgi:NADH:ubiquinone oxidoreductase subunit H
MVETYVYLAISPLPLATIPNSELSSVAKNFLKSFAAVSIQGVLIFTVLALYGTLIGSIASNDAFTDITTAMLEATLYSLVLVVCISMTGRWSKSICNAM